MITVTDEEFQKQFGHYKKAAQKEPVHVTSFDHEGVVVLSSSEYREYERLKGGGRKALYVHELTDEELEAIANAEIPAETAQFNDEYQA